VNDRVGCREMDCCAAPRRLDPRPQLEWLANRPLERSCAREAMLVMCRASRPDGHGVQIQSKAIAETGIAPGHGDSAASSQVPALIPRLPARLRASAHRIRNAGRAAPRHWPVRAKANPGRVWLQSSVRAGSDAIQETDDQQHARRRIQCHGTGPARPDGSRLRSRGRFDGGAGKHPGFHRARRGSRPAIAVFRNIATADPHWDVLSIHGCMVSMTEVLATVNYS